MIGPLVCLFLLSFALAWAAFCNGGIATADWSVSLAILGSASAGYWLFTSRRHRAPGLKRWVRWPVYALTGYLVFQLIPLPAGLLQILSPARAALLRSLGPVMPGMHEAPLSVAPPAALLGVFTLLGCIAGFLLVRELAWRFSSRPWIPLFPLVFIAALEASIGMYQVFAAWPSGHATGTYANYDHFAGLLETVLPFPVLYGVAVLRRAKRAPDSSTWRAFAACGSWLIAALLLLAVIYSLSRTGFLVGVAVLFIIGALSIGPRTPSPGRRWVSLGVLGAMIVLLLIVLPPDQLIERFAMFSSTEKLSSDTRLFLWKETLSLISEFRWFGCGLGGFESAFLKYQAAAANSSVGFAHNDYLQYLAELGIIGFALLAALLSGILMQIFRGVLQLTYENRRLIVIGCAGAFAAVLLHSLVDFNMCIPANALTLAWIGGIGSMNGLD
ncbi:MAG: O-antigen ligase family protein [Acidobacteriaceae bacterium]|nr:O-antigen ligase family protein [Acidobacteriaceae bacterium]